MQVVLPEIGVDRTARDALLFPFSKPQPSVTIRAPATVAGRLLDDVSMLATTIGERNVWCADKLYAAENFVLQRLTDLGMNCIRHEFEAENVKVRNIEASIRGHSLADEIVVIGAHYDSRCGMEGPRSTERIPGIPGTPGANDNGSGVAAMLEVARQLAGGTYARSVRFVAFVNEEHPFFQTPCMGSRVYAEQCRTLRENVVGMISLETLGYYTDAPFSQTYPFPLNYFYPRTGNFAAFLGNLRSRRFQAGLVKRFRGHTDFPTLSVSLPTPIRRMGWSDDWAFWQEGYPAISITDTAWLRYPHYHTVEDTADKLDYPRMATVVEAAGKAIRDLLKPE
jgi:Zn-dependent M28 family amino/carboxypeptidase